MKNKRLAIIVITVAFLLLIPFIAMQLTDEVNWSLFDFVLMGACLLGVGLAYELMMRRTESTSYRVAFGVGLMGVFTLFWVNGAVGIIGNEGQPANLLYGSVCAVAFIGSIIARLKSRGMARTMFATALTQMLVPIIALLIWPPPATSWAPSVLGVFLLTAFFAVLFIVSGLLFQNVHANSNIEQIASLTE